MSDGGPAGPGLLNKKIMKSQVFPPPGGTLRVFPPRLGVLEDFGKFHPISWFGWGMDSSVMGSGPTVHDPGDGQ